MSELALGPTDETTVTARLLTGDSGTQPDGSRRAEQRVGKPAVKEIRLPPNPIRPKLRGEGDSSCHGTVSSFPAAKPQARDRKPTAQ